MAFVMFGCAALALVCVLAGRKTLAHAHELHVT
jgi:hypothetical protein